MRKWFFATFVVLLMLLIAGPAYAADFRIGWDSNCYHTQWAKVDPIGGATHLHEFAATTPTNASTPATMIEENSNCLYRPQDTSGYWTPAVFDPSTNQVAKARQVAAYYRTTVEPEDVTVPPFGLKLVAGDAMATAPQSQAIVRWSCIGPNGSEVGVVFTDHPFACSDPTYAPRVNINFPQCWDAVNKDSADHKSHMAYPVYDFSTGTYKCPATHPRAIPRLNLQVTYESRSDGSTVNWNTAVMSSGGKYSMHGDWWNTPSYASSDPGSMPNLTFSCIKLAQICGARDTS